MNPARDVLALASTEVDLTPIAVGQAVTVVWRGKPVFVRHRSAEEIRLARATPLSELKDPQLPTEQSIQLINASEVALKAAQAEIEKLRKAPAGALTPSGTSGAEVEKLKADLVVMKGKLQKAELAIEAAASLKSKVAKLEAQLKGAPAKK